MSDVTPSTVDARLRPAVERERFGGRGSFVILLIALAFSPYYIIAHELLGRPTIAGKALFLAGLTGSMVGIFLYHSRYIIPRLGGVLLVGLWLAAAVLIWIKGYVYGIDLDVFAYRFAFVAVIYGCVALPFVGSVRNVRILRRVLLWSCTVQAVLGIIHSLYFPFIVTGIQLDDSGQAIYVLDPGMGGYRENGTLISSNMYGAFLVFGLMLLFANAPKVNARAFFRIAPVGALLWWGILLSGSRFALAGAVLATGYFLIKSTAPVFAVLAVPAALALFLTSPAMARVQERFAVEGSGGRGAIVTASAELATRRFSSLLLGSTTEEEAAVTTSAGRNISDNSYASLALDYGVPFMLALLFYLGLVWSSIVRLTGWTLLTALFVAGQFAVTNALYWDPFIIYAGTTLLVLDAQRRNAKHPTPVVGQGVAWA